MKVQLEKTFPMPASADTAWALLQDIEGVAACMPGAKITERSDGQHFKGTVAVKFGPANMSFRGDVEVLALEPAGKTLRLVGKGTDSTGSSGASMDLTARVEAIDAASCNLLGSSEVSMSGKAAAFGGRMMSSVADQVLKQFAANFATRVQAMQAPPAVAAAQPMPDAPGAAPAQATASAPAPAAAPMPTQLNGLALVWAVIKDWLRSLFSARKA
jgi:carbon monoxide dehydrogenase subunit G